MQKMCAKGHYYDKTYAYVDGTGGVNPGKNLNAAQAAVSLQFCVDALNKDHRCSKEFVGINPDDGQCLCVPEGDKCTEKTDSKFQFRFNKCMHAANTRTAHI